MKRQRQEKPDGKNWLVEAIGIGVMLACVVMLIAAAHAAKHGVGRIAANFEHSASVIY